MKTIAVLLENPIHVDGRVIKLIRKMSETHSVHLFYHGGRTEDAALFSERVQLHNIPESESLGRKILRHSWFYRVQDSLYYAALSSGIAFNGVWCNDLVTLRQGVMLKKALGCRLIYDSHEIYLETLNQFFPLNAGWKQPIYNSLLAFMRARGEAAEARYLRHLDAFVTVNQSLVDFFRQKYHYQEPIHIIMNCPPRLQTAPAGIQFRSLYNWDKDDFIFLFQGSLNAGRGLEKLMRIIPDLPENLRFVFLGKGPLYTVMEKWILQENLSQRVKLGQVNASEILDYCAGADAGINLLEPINKSKEFTSATKLFEYIQVGLPSVNSAVIENERVFAKYTVGLLIENDEESIRQALIKMAQMKAGQFREACRQAALEYCWENQSTKITEMLP